MGREQVSREQAAQRLVQGIFGIWADEERRGMFSLLARNEEGLSASALRSQLFILLQKEKQLPPSSVSNYINGLEQEGLVERVGGKARLTPLGKLAFQLMTNDVDQMAGHIARGKFQAIKDVLPLDLLAGVLESEREKEALEGDGSSRPIPVPALDSK